MQEKLVRGDLRTLFAVASLSLTNYNRQDAQDRTDSAAHSGRPVEWEPRARCGVPPPFAPSAAVCAHHLATSE